MINERLTKLKAKRLVKEFKKSHEKGEFRNKLGRIWWPIWNRIVVPVVADSGIIFEAQAQQNIPKGLSDKIAHFLGVNLSEELRDYMGLVDCSHDREYLEKANLARKNLENYSASTCLNKMLALLGTSEGQAFLKTQGKDSVLTQKIMTAEFMKKLLLPSSSANILMMTKKKLTK